MQHFNPLLIEKSFFCKNDERTVSLLTFIQRK